MGTLGYDIVWVAPRFQGQRLVSPARITIFQNGLLLHHDQALLGPTRHRTTTWYDPTRKPDRSCCRIMVTSCATATCGTAR